jgi:hypothetical protein
MEECHICKHPSHFLFKKQILHKYVAEYFQCDSCHFVQVKNPIWLNEAYQNAISPLDTGLVSRNLSWSSFTESFILKNFDKRRQFIDYGGGCGLFVRLMRDKGFDFYRQDNYCQNLFAQHFDITDLKRDGLHFELLTAFELFEHLVSPVAEVENMLAFSDSILFSTELQPLHENNLENWWYLSPSSGQHISFFTKESLRGIADKLKLQFYTNDATLHLLSRKQFKDSPFKTNPSSILFRIKNKVHRLSSPTQENRSELKSLTQLDNETIEKKQGTI